MNILINKFNKNTHGLLIGKGEMFLLSCGDFLDNKSNKEESKEELQRKKLKYLETQLKEL